jgi:hypothetical protein
MQGTTTHAHNDPARTTMQHTTQRMTTLCYVPASRDLGKCNRKG